MRLFVDTSALYSLMDRNDQNHTAAQSIWKQVLADDIELVTSNYVLMEVTALIQSRIGIAALRDFDESIAALMTVYWVDSGLHATGIAAVLAANRRRLSLVDCVSFSVCRRLSIEHVFAFDPHFDEQGFLPAY